MKKMQNISMLLFFAILAFLCIAGRSLGAAGYGNTDAQEYGDAVYTDLWWDWIPGVYNYNHAGVYAGINVSDSERVIEAPVADNNPDNSFYSSFYSQGSNYYGAYTLSNKSLSFLQRKEIVKTAQDLVAANIGYTFNDALDYEWTSFDGTIEDILNIRCDGVVEYCYEKHGHTVWWDTDHSSQWNIATDAGVDWHNNMPGTTVDPDFELSPWAQRGAPPYTGPGFDQENNPNNTFLTQSALVDLPTYGVSMWQSGDHMVVEITATDSKSGIHRIGYMRPGESSWSYSRNVQHPDSDTFTQQYNVYQEGWFNYFAQDNGGNYPETAEAVYVEFPAETPSSPSLSSPSNGSTVNGTSITFYWNSSSGATNYHMQIATDSSFNNLVYDSDMGNTTSIEISGFPNNGTRFYWHVKAGNSAGWSGYSGTWYFNNGTVSTPPAPSLSSPSNGSIAYGTTIEFRWNTSTGADNYYLQVATDSSFDDIIYDDEVGNYIGVNMSGFPDNGTRYYWRVKAGNSSGWSGYSSTWYFDNGVPPTGSLNVTIEPSEARSAGAQWKLTSGPDTNWKNSNQVVPSIPVGSYTLQFKDIAGFAEPVSRTIEIIQGTNTDSGTYSRIYSGGSGEPNDTFVISNADDLLAMRNNPASWGSYFILSDDIDMTGHTFTTAIIGTGTAFNGVFDGNGYKIIGLTINGTGNGLFGLVGADGIISNLSIKSVAISGQGYVGGLIGQNGGMILNCYVTGEVSGNYNAGGLVGVNYGNLSNCYVKGNVVNEANSAGGLAGLNYGSISNCYSTGSVTSTLYAGGLVGSLRFGSTISNCYSIGSVSSSSSSSNAGGLVGRNDGGMIIASFWDIETSGQTASAGGEGKTTAEMQDIDTFLDAGWDFIMPVWKIYNGINYPKLAWQQLLAGDFASPDGVDYYDLAVFVDQWLLEEQSYDLNNDGIVNFLDFAVFANNWQGDTAQLYEFASQWLKSSVYCADIAPSPDGDGIVNFIDFALFAENWLTQDATVQADFVASYNGLSPTIDGVLSEGEWGSSYTVTMDRADGGGQHDINLYFQNDGTYLFIGVDSQWGTGWDVVWNILIDGDYSRSINGNLSQPYTDINICQQSPSGYPGYRGYYTKLNIGEEVIVGYDSGADSASSGSTNVSYEFRIPLADLGVIPGDSIGLIITHGYDGISEHLYELSSAGSRTTPENWATLTIE